MINFNFDRNGDSHKTLFGGIYSLFIKIFLIGYIYINAKKIFFHNDDGNVTTVGLLDTDKLGHVNVVDESNAMLIYVLRK